MSKNANSLRFDNTKTSNMYMKMFKKIDDVIFFYKTLNFNRNTKSNATHRKNMLASCCN